jgi:hypothetical protein
MKYRFTTVGQKWVLGSLHVEFQGGLLGEDLA